MTYLSQLKDKNIVVLGAGITGLSCARFLHSKGLSFAINDSRENIFSAEESAPYLATADCISGYWDFERIAQADVLIVSPGIDLAQQNISSRISANTEVIGDVELFCRISDTPIIAVTGSNGKSTVVSLLNYVGETLGYNVALGGNIGVPVLDRLTNNSAKLDYLIVELSSFQLETIASMQARAAIVLNVSDDHLDRHQTLENYANIKKKIYQNSATKIFSREDALTTVPQTLISDETTSVTSIGLEAPQTGHFGIHTQAGQPYLAYGSEILGDVSSLPLAGMHNALNYLAVLALGNAVGWPLKAIYKAFGAFHGLAHRCERIESNDNIIWINDSKATNVGATLAAIEGLAPMVPAENQLILIAGGEGKGADFSVLKPAIDTSVSRLITYGKDGNKIAKLSQKSTEVANLVDAVSNAKQLAAAGDIVLLSPACASIDMFKNFEERGQVFCQAVQATMSEVAS